MHTNICTCAHKHHLLLLLLPSPAISLDFTILLFLLPSPASSLGFHHFSSSAFPSYIFGVHHSSSAFPSYISGLNHSSSSAFPSYITGLPPFFFFCLSQLYDISLRFTFFFFCLPQLHLWGLPFWVRFLHMWPLFNPTTEVVIFRLHGWCILGVFVASIHPPKTWMSGSSESRHVCKD